MMITLFNRAEVLQTNEQTAFFAAQQKLSHVGIDYRTKVRDLAYQRGDRRGTLGIRSKYLYEYLILSTVRTLNGRYISSRRIDREKR